MPTNRRRIVQSRRLNVARLDYCREYHLLRGRPMIEGYATRDELESAWAIHGEALLAEWIEQHPGTRPFAWWLCDHGHERPVIDSRPCAQQFADAMRREGGKFEYLHTHTIPPLQEDEAAYLARHGLLTAAERRALGLNHKEIDLCS